MDCTISQLSLRSHHLIISSYQPGFRSSLS